MGLCGSKTEQDSEEVAQNKQVENAIADQKRVSKEKKKLLFLGTGGSGKSTFMKQIMQNYGKGFTADEKLWWKIRASLNVLESLIILGDEAINMKENDDLKVDAEDDDQFYDDFDAVKTVLRNSQSSKKKPTADFVVINGKETETVDRFRKHSLIQFSYENRGKFPFDFGDIEYFYDRLEKLCDPNYVFTHEDVVFVRSRTNGIYEQNVVINDVEMIFIDVAGQASSRQKWISCFEDVTIVIWVSALDNYNEVLPENPELNAMDDAIDAFEWAVNHPMLRNPAFALFLNKIDLLERHVTGNSKKFALKNYFDDFEGEDGNTEQAAQYIKELFLSAIPDGKEVPAYTVQGTDGENAHKVLDSVIFGLLQSEMASLFG